MEDYKVFKGDKVRLLQAHSYDGYILEKGTILEITSPSGRVQAAGNLNCLHPKTLRNIGIPAFDLEKAKLTISELSDDLKRLDEECDLLKKKINWMRNTKTSEYDDNKFKTWQILLIAKKEKDEDKATEEIQKLLT